MQPLINNSDLTLFNTIMVVCLALGGFFAFRSGRNTAIIKFKDDTIKALQDRLAVVEANQEDIRKENAVLHHTIETIQSALKQRGIVVTIDGDMIIIQDADGRSSYQKRKDTSSLSSSSPSPPASPTNKSGKTMSRKRPSPPSASSNPKQGDTPGTGA